MRKLAMAVVLLVACSKGDDDGNPLEEQPDASRCVPLEVTNLLETEIWEIYIADPGSETWGTDLLGGSTMPVGASFTVPSVCCTLHDTLTVHADGTECEQFNTGLCERWNITSLCL